MNNGKITTFTSAGDLSSYYSSFLGPCMVYRGDWSPYNDYGYQNCVTFRCGLGKGVYIASEYVAAGEQLPILNIKWTKIACLNGALAEIINFTP